MLNTRAVVLILITPSFTAWAGRSTQSTTIANSVNFYISFILAKNRYNFYHLEPLLILHSKWKKRNEINSNTGSDFQLLFPKSYTN